MPLLSRIFLRLALLHLVTGTVLGAWLLGAKGGWPPAPPAWFRSAHVELLLLGWIVNLIMGTAYWILPRHATGPARGRAGPVVIALLAFNAGVAVTAAGWAPAGGRTLEVAGAAAFALHAWSRVRPSFRP